MEHCLSLGGVLMVILDLRIYNVDLSFVVRVCVCVSQDVKWAEFGFGGRDGQESTLWIGTEGANTPCHQDAYGYNLVLQVQGR